MRQVLGISQREGVGSEANMARTIVTNKGGSVLGIFNAPLLGWCVGPEIQGRPVGGPCSSCS